MSMTKVSLTLGILPEIFAVCRLPASSTTPKWVAKSPFFSVSKTPKELSIVCVQENVPSDIKCERNWSCFEVQGPLDFRLTGILDSLTDPLAAAGISIFSISTFDTDYLLVKQENLKKAVVVLKEAGHVVQTA